MADSGTQQDIVRPKFTYGRRQLLDEGISAPNSLSDSPRVEYDASTSDDHSGRRGSPVNISFGWKEKMLALDQSDDEIESAGRVSVNRTSGNASPTESPFNSRSCDQPLDASSSSTLLSESHPDTSISTIDTFKLSGSQETRSSSPPTSPAPDLSDDEQHVLSSSKDILTSRDIKKTAKLTQPKPLTKKEEDLTRREQARIMAGEHCELVCDPFYVTIMADKAILIDKQPYRNLSMNEFFNNLR